MLRAAFFTVILIFILIFPGCKKHNVCADLIDAEINGIVINKEIAKRFKAPYIYYTDAQGKEQSIKLTDYDKKLYNFVIPGDSIYKRHHTRDISILRKGRGYTYPLECGPNLTR